DYSYWDRSEGEPALAPVTELNVKASIARPASGETVPAGKDYRVHGAAWAGESGGVRGEGGTDGGKTWNDVTLLGKPGPPWGRALSAGAAGAGEEGGGRDGGERPRGPRQSQDGPPPPLGGGGGGGGGGTEFPPPFLGRREKGGGPPPPPPPRGGPPPPPTIPS